MCSFYKFQSSSESVNKRIIQNTIYFRNFTFHKLYKTHLINQDVIVNYFLTQLSLQTL